MDSNGSIVFNITQLIMGNPTAAHMCCFHALIVDWAFEPDELSGFLYAVECAHSFEYIAIHCHNLPYLCILRIKMCIKYKRACGL